MKESSCRSCEARIIWARTEHGRRIPLDATPVAGVERGTFVLRDTTSTEGPLAIAATPAQMPGDSYYVTHFATCPNADQHRRAPEATLGRLRERTETENWSGPLAEDFARIKAERDRLVEKIQREWERATASYDKHRLSYDEGRMDFAGELLAGLASMEGGGE